MRFLIRSNSSSLISVLAIVILATVQFFVIKYAYRLKLNDVESDYQNVYQYAQPNLRVQWNTLDSVTIAFRDKNSLFNNGHISDEYAQAIKQYILDTAQVKRSFNTYFSHVELIDEIDYSIELSKLKINLQNRTSESKDNYLLLGGNANNARKKLVYRHLLQSDYLSGELLLYISFPNQGYFLFKQMKWVFIFSTITFMMITFVALNNLRNATKHKRASEIKDDLINHISHEFRTPITSIGLASKSIRDNIHELSEDRIFELTKAISRQNGRLQRHVDSLLTSAFLDQDQEIKLKAVNLNKALSHIKQDYELIISQAEASLNLNTEAITDLVLLDEFLFSTAIGNILENALKYSQGKIQISISTYNDADSKHYIIAIADNGPGIANDIINNVFDKFYRSSSSNQMGLGLGLYNVNVIIKRFNGQVWVENNHLKGCTFYIKLPVTDV